MNGRTKFERLFRLERHARKSKIITSHETRRILTLGNETNMKKRLNQKIKKQNIYEKGQTNLKLTYGEAADVDCKDIHGIQSTLCPEFWSLKYLIITSIDAQNQIYLYCR